MFINSPNSKCMFWFYFSFVFMFKPLDIVDQCGDGIGYRVYWKPGKHVALVGTENYYLLYDVMVGSFNRLGDGPNSTIVDVYSAEGCKD